MKRTHSASVTLTVSQIPGQRLMGNSGGILAAPAMIVAGGDKRPHLDLPISAWATAAPALPDVAVAARTPPQWSVVQPQQQPLQPSQLCATLLQQNPAAATASGGGGTTPHMFAQVQMLPQQQQEQEHGGPQQIPQPAGLQFASITTQLSSSQLQLPQDHQQDHQQLHQQHTSSSSHQTFEEAAVTATVTLTAQSAGKGGAASAAMGQQEQRQVQQQADANLDQLMSKDDFLSQLQAQLNKHHNEAAAAVQQQQQQLSTSTTAAGWSTLSHQHQHQHQQPCVPLEELQLLLPAVHAEYKAEMKLMLRACQVASNVTKHSPSTGTTLLMDPAAREQLQRQVLLNCNEKHGVVVAAFKHTAQLVEAAAAAAGCSSSFDGKQPGQAAAAGAGAGASAAAGAGSANGGASTASMLDVWQSLQQLRSSYQQELVAATSALFAICRGFGQCYALSPTASASIKSALAAAQQQHGRVEQFWQDIVLAAGGVV